MEELNKLAEHFIRGVKEAAEKFEADPSFQAWWENNPRFREKCAERLSRLIHKVQTGTRL